MACFFDFAYIATALEITGAWKEAIVEEDPSPRRPGGGRLHTTHALGLGLVFRLVRIVLPLRHSSS